jgi:hypothetical protein
MTRMFVVILVCAIVFGAAGAFAADAQPSTRSAAIAQSFADLADAEPAVRDRARVDLMGISSAELVELRDLVQRNRPLAPAQAAALHDIVLHVYLSGDAYASTGRDGFLGVMLEPVRQDGVLVPDELMADPSGELGPGVLVRECMPGFAGFRFLRRGDVVRGTAGEKAAPTPTLAELKSAVRATRPGQTLALQVLRQGKLIEVGVVVSARPSDAVDEVSMRQMQERRITAAEEYWRRAFAALVEREVAIPFQ